ncbi:MAG: hypothetical protein M1598_04130 [Actinobacteria bacterium]|nr:hypothetical protein [Actinomycetota bacterium]
MAEQQSYSPGEACEQLGITPRSFRQIMVEFAEVLEGPSDDDASGQISGSTLRKLELIARLRNEGRDSGEIIEQVKSLGSEEENPSANHEEELLRKQGVLLERLDQLTRELSRSEERRVEDRDRMLTALMRTQQEIQHLRYELAAQTSRRARKPKGFLQRLFG